MSSARPTRVSRDSRVRCSRQWRRAAPYWRTTPAGREVLFVDLPWAGSVTLPTWTPSPAHFGARLTVPPRFEPTRQPSGSWSFMPRKTSPYTGLKVWEHSSDVHRQPRGLGSGSWNPSPKLFVRRSESEMLAPATLPLRYQWFNLRWGAPRGRPVRKLAPRRLRATRLGAALVGPFAFQTNNTTRAFEYPWAFEALQVRPGLRVLEIGGALSGFQFVLDRAGCEVVNLDPGDEFHTAGWPVTPATMAVLNAALGTKVNLKTVFLDQAGFADESFDRVVSISVFEHIPERALLGILGEV